MTTDGVDYSVVGIVVGAILTAWAIPYGLIALVDFFKRVVGR